MSMSTKSKKTEYSVNNLKQPTKMAEFLDWDTTRYDTIGVPYTSELLNILAILRTYFSGQYRLLTNFNEYIKRRYEYTQSLVANSRRAIAFYKQEIQEYEQKAPKDPELRKKYLDTKTFAHKELERFEEKLKNNLPAPGDVLSKLQDIIDVYNKFHSTMVLTIIHDVILTYKLKGKNVKDANNRVTNHDVKYISIPLIQLVEKTRQFLSEILVTDYNYPKTNKKDEIYTQAAEHGIIYDADLFLEYEQFRNYIAHPKKYAQELYSCDIHAKLFQIMGDYEFCIKSLVEHTNSNLQIGLDVNSPDLPLNSMHTKLLGIMDAIIQIAKQHANNPKKYLDELDMILSAQNLRIIKYWHQVRKDVSHGKQKTQSTPHKSDIDNLNDIMLNIQQYFDQHQFSD